MLGRVGTHGRLVSPSQRTLNSVQVQPPPAPEEVRPAQRVAQPASCEHSSYWHGDQAINYERAHYNRQWQGEPVCCMQFGPRHGRGTAGTDSDLKHRLRRRCCSVPWLGHGLETLDRHGPCAEHAQHAWLRRRGSVGRRQQVLTGGQPPRSRAGAPGPAGLPCCEGAGGKAGRLLGGGARAAEWRAGAESVHRSPAVRGSSTAVPPILRRVP